MKILIVDDEALLVKGIRFLFEIYYKLFAAKAR